MSNWTDKLKEFGCSELFDVSEESAAKTHAFADNEWQPVVADKSAAGDLYAEIRTRITTHPLAYFHGDEETALRAMKIKLPRCAANRDE